jgi:ribosomal protein S18 acetylase RimI-like enzyme
MCNAETKVGEIGLNAVHPTAQGRGVGQRLYTAALDRMRAEGSRRLECTRLR